MAAADIFRDVCAWTSLRDAIRAWYGIESEHVGCEHVVETCDDSVLWEGTVEVFRVLDGPRASFVYAWSDDASAGGPSHVAVLGTPPISGARDAVHAVMATRLRPG
jgi:hypothetical protein